MSPKSATTSSRANLILILLVVLNVLNIVDRNLISSFGPQITEDLKLTNTQFGWLTGLIFVFFYAVMGLFVGWLADVTNRPRLITAGLVLWSALTMISGAAKNFTQIAIARLFVGVGEACLSPAAISMLADLFPQSKRGLASSIYYLGVPLGAGASFVAAGVLGPHLGWRNCFYLLGALGLILAPLIFLLRDPQRGVHDSRVHQMHAIPSATIRSSFAAVAQLARQSPALGWTMLGAVFMHLPIGSAQFAQIWLVRERGFDAADIATTYGLLFIVFGTLGALLSGVMSDWYLKHFKGGRTRFLALFLLVLTPFLIGYRFAEPDSLVFYIGMCAGFVAFMSMFGPSVSTIQDLAPAQLRGMTVAFLLLAINLLGLGIGAVVAGVLSDVYAQHGVTQPLTWSLVTIDVISILTVVSFYIASVYWCRQFPEPIKS